MTPERFATLRDRLDKRQPDLTVLMDDVHKSHNVSAVIRTCDAVGIFEAHAFHADGPLRRHDNTSAGAGRYVGLRQHPDIATGIRHLKDQGFRVLAAHFSDRAVEYRKIDYTQPTALLLGSELNGCSETAAAEADEHVIIPMQGLVASLNVSVAAAVILFEAQRQRLVAGLYDESRLDPGIRERVLFEWAHPKIAHFCRQRGYPYPGLTGDGDLAHAPGPAASK
ncbi:MAG: tRNA (guanosine(18)-2'-O)-methyltransferase TrmH [Gammaproteobacteria bacterium]|nr:tRNA (guanosine(18)-2'-O)-methyltransferase TrmH [Gammaproteobacteria bacterium]